MAHAYSVIFRLTPPAGPQTTINASAMSFLSVAQPRLEAVFTEQELIDRSIAVTPYGYRCMVDMEFQFPTPSTDETSLADNLITRAMDDDWTIELSLDGGTTYREVVLTGFSQEPMGGKNIGVVQSMTWVCSGLLDEKPSVESGSW